MPLFSLFYLLLFLSFSTHAQVFSPIVRSTAGAEKIIIRGYNGRLQVVGTDSETLKVEASKKGSQNWSPQVRQTGTIIEVSVKGPSDREDWEGVRGQSDIPEFQIKVTVPHKRLEIFWEKGSFVAQAWKANLSLQMNEGDIKVTGSQGNLMLQLIKGRIQVEQHSGNLEIQSFKGQVTLGKTTGSLSINNHSSRYSLVEHKGPLEIKNHSGTMAIRDLKGNAVIKNINGVLSLKEASGSVDGTFTKGAFDAQFKVLQSFSINSDEARISVTVPKESGARVSLRSEKGHLRAPLFLGKTRKGRWTERRGRLKGKEQGNIKIISKYGDIVLK